MQAQWDIVGDVFPGIEVVTRTVSARRATRVPTSAVVTAVTVLSAAAAISLVPTTCSPGSGASNRPLELARRTLPHTVPARDPSESVDFGQGRTAEQLADAFGAFFAPSSIDEEDQVDFVFG